MAQRQFRSDDTAAWGIRYGNSSNAAKTYAANHTLDSGDLFYNGTFTGTSGATTGTTGIADGTYNLPCIIHQSRGTGAGTWELNFLTTISGGTATFSYSLINTYNTGAQIVTGGQYSAITLNSGVTIQSPAWNGSTGGIALFLCSGTTSLPGTITSVGQNGGAPGGGAGMGYSGGLGGNNTTQAQQGEGTAGASGGSSSANGNGGGGGLNTGGAPGEAQGGAGGNATAGANGSTLIGGGSVGTGGGTAGSADLTSMVFGGGGGGTASHNGSGGITPGSGGGGGGGIVVIISRIITVTGSITANGGVGGTDVGGVFGGAGAGGSILFKGQSITLGSSLVTASGGASGPAGGNGRIHIDYSNTLSGTTTPTLDSRQDVTLADSGGSFLFNMI